MTTRRILYLVHLYGGLVLGAAVVFVGLTGSAVVYRPELERLLNPEWFTVSPQHAPQSLDALVRNAVQTYPDGRPTFVSIQPPLAPDETAMVVMKRRFGDGSGPWVRAHVDPYSGRVVTSFVPEDTLFGFLTLLHVSLLTGEHEWGEQVVGVAGILLVVFCVTGLVLWWPGLRRLRSGFQVRKGRGARVLCYDLHRVFGIVLLLPLLLVAVTGVVLVFPQYTRAPLAKAFEVERAPRPPKAGGGPVRVTLDQVKDIVARAHPEARLIAIQLPASAKATYQARLLQPGDSKVRYGGGAKLVVWIDPASGEILKEHDARSMPVSSRLMFQWIFPTHTGDIAGWAGRLVMFLAGLVPLLLFVTGAYVWYSKRRRSVAERAVEAYDAGASTRASAVSARTMRSNSPAVPAGS